LAHHAHLLSLGLLIAIGACTQEPTTPTDDATTESTAAPQTQAADESDDSHAAAREIYNDALAAYDNTDHEAAATGMLKARDNAGGDTELRFRAAFNLGMALAAQSDDAAKDEEQPPEARLTLLRQAAAWFRDAVRLRSNDGPDNEDARVNLELLLGRIRALADQIGRDRGALLQRLSRIIDDQRGLRDGVRQIITKLGDSGAIAATYAEEFAQLATSERELLTDAREIAFLAAEERSGLSDQTNDEQPSPEDQMRIIQLDNLDVYLQSAIDALESTRRVLRRLDADSGGRRAMQALSELKRAREQLQDPLTALKALVQDQTLTASQTDLLVRLSQIAVETTRPSGRPKPPAWLSSENLGDTQQTLALRSAELQARLAAGVGTGGDQMDDETAMDPQQQRLSLMVNEAIPFVSSAVANMNDATTALEQSSITAAVKSQAKAIGDLFEAIERFAATRDLIELLHKDQAQMVMLLTDSPAQNDIPEAHRSQITTAILDKNRGRLSRLQGMLIDDRDEQLAAATAPENDGEDAAAADKTATESITTRFEMAEKFRAAALAALDEIAHGTASELARVRPLAHASQEHIEELRRLFFSIVEHLKDLLRAQTETHDGTATVQGGDDEQRGPKLPPLLARQETHAALGGALAEGLAAQADAAMQDPNTAEQGQALADAAPEVTLATQLMVDATTALGTAQQDAATMSVDLEPTLDMQLAAMEHLENAIRILQPPQQQQQQGDDSKQQQNQQQQQQQQQDSEEVSKRQAQRRLQAIREREAERERNRRQNQRTQREPVERDW